MTVTVPDCAACDPINYCEYRGKWFDCPGCGSVVPWCYGGADDMPELCDGCWCEVTEKRKSARQELEVRDG